ncbi:MAG: hypothetical protein HY913_20590 [Desulfomonile tiedjei]|nr:hypothetical protein [Desulfomonile tiedjei]
MTAIPWFHLFPFITASTGFYSDGRHFDTSNPKILLGLLIGGSIPYFLPAIPAAVTKWLILTLAFKTRPRIARIVLVAVLEPLCFMVITALLPYTLFPLQPDLFEPPLILLIYPVFLMLPNLLLFPPRGQLAESGYHFPRRMLYAFAIGLIYCTYFPLVLLTLGIWLGKY